MSRNNKTSTKHYILIYAMAKVKLNLKIGYINQGNIFATKAQRHQENVFKNRFFVPW